jgi:hypothetical protein
VPAGVSRGPTLHWGIGWPAGLPGVDVACGSRVIFYCVLNGRIAGCYIILDRTKLKHDAGLRKWLPPKIYTRPLHVPSGFLANVPEFKQGFLAELRLLCYCTRIAGTVQVEDSRRNEIAPWWLRN